MYICRFCVAFSCQSIGRMIASADDTSNLFLSAGTRMVLAAFGTRRFLFSSTVMLLVDGWMQWLWESRESHALGRFPRP